MKLPVNIYLQNTKVYDYEDSEVMYVDMYGTTQMLYKDGELKYGKEGDEYLSCLYIDEADGNADDLISFYTDGNHRGRSDGYEGRW